MSTALFIAWRYLFAKKSHNVINVISAISAIGMGVGTAALILIMSVYNGFEGIIENNMSDIDPDILMTCSEGKFFVPDADIFSTLEDDDRISSINCVIEDNVFFTYGERQGIARAKGVDLGYENHSLVGNHVIEGSFSLYEGDICQAAVGSHLAYQNGIHPRFLDPMTLYYPERGVDISLANPAASLNCAEVWPSCLISISSTVDAGTVIVPLSTMQELIGDYDLLTGIEIRLKDNSGKSVRQYLKNTGIEGGYAFKDRFSQNPSLYRMMKYEKLAIYLILIFVVIIISFNIFGSLSMLKIEKEEDSASLKAMGASEGLVRKIFVFEGWMITLAGMLGGLVIGIVIVLAQQHFGIVKMPGNFLMSTYPVVLKLGDVLSGAAAIALIGLATALLQVSQERQG